jgi:hypothetical protein
MNAKAIPRTVAAPTASRAYWEKEESSAGDLGLVATVAVEGVLIDWALFGSLSGEADSAFSGGLAAL